MAKTRIVMDKAGLANLLKSSDMADVVQGVAQDVANAAGGDYAVTVEHDRRKSRVIAHVLGDSLRHEMETGNLARAVGSQESGWRR